MTDSHVKTLKSQHGPNLKQQTLAQYDRLGLKTKISQSLSNVKQYILLKMLPLKVHKGFWSV